MWLLKLKGVEYYLKIVKVIERTIEMEEVMGVREVFRMKGDLEA